MAAVLSGITFMAKENEDIKSLFTTLSESLRLVSGAKAGRDTW